MAVRPSQIRASAAEAAVMNLAAHTLESECRRLDLPVAILAGEEDRLIESEQGEALT